MRRLNEAPSDSDSPRPSSRFAATQAFLVFLAYLGGQLWFGFIAGIAVAIWYELTHPQGAIGKGEELMRAGVAMGASIGMLGGGAVAFWLARRMARRDAADASLAPFGWTASTSRAMLWSAFAGVLIAVTYIFVFLAVFPPPKNIRSGLMERAVEAGGWSLYMWAVLALAIAPPVEEFVFRGLLWTGFSRSWGPVLSGITVTGLFVALHLPQAWAYAPNLAAIGALGLAALAARILSGSLVPAVLLHAGYNAVVVIATLGAYA